jgi:hypothetical protein
VRENRTHGSEGGDGESRFRPLSSYAAKPLSGAKIDDAISLAQNLEEVADVAVLTKLLTA